MMPTVYFVVYGVEGCVVGFLCGLLLLWAAATCGNVKNHLNIYILYIIYTLISSTCRALVAQRFAVVDTGDFIFGNKRELVQN